MNKEDSFIDSARALSRNPLGIIALFIVLVYAVASIVLSFAGPEFYSNPWHPAVVFLAVFPLLVLAAFTFLVARHHRNLYAPRDYKDSKDFFHGLRIPEQLEGVTAGAATSEASPIVVSRDSIEGIEAKYTRLIEAGFALVHEAHVLQQRTSPRSGRYQIRVWLEAIKDNSLLKQVDCVTYHVWPDFQVPVLSTSDPKSSFDLWITTYGEFPVLAVVKLKSGVEVEVNRYIDLPGRPAD